MRVCFISLQARSLLQDGGARYVGGAERQVLMIAEQLRLRHHDTSFIVSGEGNERLERSSTEYGAMMSLPAPRMRRIRGLGLVENMRWLLRALKAADADAYYLRGASAMTLPVALWCRAHARAFVYACAHDTDCAPSGSEHAQVSDPALLRMYRTGLVRAHAIIAQHESQALALRQNFSLDAYVVANAVALAAGIDEEHDENFVLFVGRLNDFKRPELFVELARELPQFSFRMVGEGPSRTKMLGGKPPPENLMILGHRPPAEVHRLMRAASVFVSTSTSEGMPNVFLEAWSVGTPVLSLSVDPGGVMTRNGLGSPAESLDELRRRIQHLMTDRDAREALGSRGQDYVGREHSPTRLGASVENLLVTMLRERRGMRSLRCERRPK